MKTVAFIQARMGSSRLPGKVLKTLAGKPVLLRVLERVRKSKVDEPIVLTSTQPGDDVIEQVAQSWGYRVFRGSESDVLDRFWQAAKAFRPDRLVRITADCPVIDPAVIDLVLDAHVASGSEYCSNVLGQTYPDGQDVEVLNSTALERAWNEARLLSDREHVTMYIRQRPELFRHHSVDSPVDLGKKRWTLDTPEDFGFIEGLYERLSPSNEFFGMAEILELLNEGFELERLNSHLTRNHAYFKSLANDKCIK